MNDICADLSIDKGLLYGAGGWHYCRGPMRTPIDAEALSALFSDAWFSRFWPVQEVVLAPKNLCFRGHYTANFSDIVDVARWLWNYYRYYTCEDFGSTYPYANAASIGWLRSVARANQIGIQNVLGGILRFRVSDDRDMIYGMLGMVYPSGNVPKLLVPDYSKSLAEVVRDACLYTIEQERSAEPFRYLYHSTNHDLTSDDFPTWTYRIHRQQFDDVRILTALSFPRLPKWPGTLAESASSSNACRNTLKLRGLELGTILKLWELFSRDEYGPLEQVPELLCAEGGLVAQEHSVESLARTLIVNDLIVRQDDTFNVVVDFRIWFDQYLDSPADGTELRQDEDLWKRTAQLYYSTLWETCAHRRFMITTDGRIGLCPEICIQGDIVVLLSMAPMTIILRPIDEYYLMIGECYLDGAFSDDGGSGELNLDDVQEQVFEIH